MATLKRPKKLDVTVPGGRYLNAKNQLVDAEGRPLPVAKPKKAPAPVTDVPVKPSGKGK